MPVIGVLLSGRQRTSTGYFIGNRQMSWWLVTLSVVATETSTLTVISVPTVAYLGNITYLQLAIGYLIGRTLVAFVLLPKYYTGKDRKSTRLNSSHVAISYAVFCLKKKRKSSSEQT